LPKEELHAKAVREYVRKVNDLPAERRNDAALLLKIVADHCVEDKLGEVISSLQKLGHFVPPKKMLAGHSSAKVSAAVLSYLSDHGTTPNAIGLGQAADFNGIRSRVLREVLASFHLTVPKALPPMIRSSDEYRKPRKPR